MQMKYSLSNKQLKKRNNIFGERKHDLFSQEEFEKQLDSIKELGEDLEDSTFHNDLVLKDVRSQKIQKKAEIQRITQRIPERDTAEKMKKSIQPKVGKHGLSPNVKPSVPIIRTSAKSIIESKSSFMMMRRKLSLHSNVIQFQYYSQETQEQLAQTRQLLQKLYMILAKNNERVNSLENLLCILTSRSNYTIGELQFSLSYAVKLEKKVNLFLNTMRNVYENLRISKLKQQNLELFLKQTFQQRKCEDKMKQNIELSKAKPQRNDKNISFKEAEQLMSLLDYESENSIVEPYIQKQEKYKQTPKQTQHVRSVYYEENMEKDQANYKNQQSTGFQRKYSQCDKETFRVKQGNYERLSPFEANRQILSSSASSSLHQAPKISQAVIKSVAVQRQSPRSNWSYSFEANECQKIRSWIKKKGEDGMKCWLDDMGCLRRPNMTYVFWPNGEVMRMSIQAFQQLQLEGAIERHGEQ